MKIIQLVTRRQYRGAEVFAAELSKELSRRGYVVLFTGLYAAPEHKLNVADCINIDFNERQYFFNPLLLWKLIQLIRKEKPAIVQANGSDTLKYAVFAKFFSGNCKVIYRNISILSAWGSNSFKRKFNSFLFRHTDFVTSVGQQALADLIKTYRYPQRLTRVIRRGIPQFQFDRVLSRSTLLRKAGFSDADLLLVHVGRFSPEKNHFFLLDVFKIILQSCSNAKLIFVGEGTTKNAVELACSSFSHAVYFAGHQSNVQEVISGCDILLLSSLVEGVPGVILEAALQSVPTVAVNVGGVSEVINNGDTGIIIQKHDAVAFAGAVIELFHDKSKMSRLGENAFNFVAANYTVGACADEFDKLYNQLTTS